MKEEDLPFDIQEITKVTEYFTGNVVSLTLVNDGWKRLTRTAGKTFFKLYYTAEPTGLNSLQKDTGLKVFPNPANDSLSINLNGIEGIQSVQVFNQKGELIKETEVEKITHVNISGFTNGIYLVHLKGFPQHAQKFIKQ